VKDGLRVITGAALAVATLCAIMTDKRVLILLIALPILLRVLRPRVQRLPRLPGRWPLAVVMVAAVGVRLLCLATVPNAPVSDFAAYQELSVAMATGQGYAMIGAAGREDADLYLGKDTALPHPTAFRAPGTALWGLLAGGNPAWFRLINVALGAGTCALIFLMLEPAGIALTAGLLWALYPSAVFATTLYGSEVLYGFFLALMAWMLSRIPSGRAPVGRLALTGLCAAWLGLAMKQPSRVNVSVSAEWCSSNRRGNHRVADRSPTILPQTPCGRSDTYGDPGGKTLSAQWS